MNRAEQIEEERSKRLVAMGQMAASLAHEIRNPLGSMELYCSLLRKDLEDKPEQQQLAEQILIGIRRLDALISNCLRFVRDSVPKYETLPSVKPLLEEIIQNAQAKAQQANITINLESSGEYPVSVDPYLIGQALLNLVINAIEAAIEQSRMAGNHSQAVRLVSSMNNSAWWQLSIEDSGIGIPEEKLATIFDPFVTSKSEGTGLGLAIVHSIISAHHGRIKITSQQGLGTTVRVEIPRFPPPEMTGKS